MKEKLKEFFKDHLQNKGNEKKEEAKGIYNSGREQKWVTYNEWGFQKSGLLAGNLLAFKGCLNLVQQHFLYNQGVDATKIERDKANAQTEIEKINLEIENKEFLIDKFKKKIDNWKEKITSLTREIIDIKENPESIMKDKVSKVGFFIGLIILIMLTIYLFVFYSSASYSALFKQFTLNDIGVVDSVFDPKAIQIAWQTSWTELILIVLIPAIFLGLGYLIHKFQEAKGIGRFFKIGVLILITFVFDAILAYEITEKIYNIKAGNSFQDMPEYTLSFAFQSIMFWLIIFLGFIVYIIWGFVFDFVMEAYDKLDFVKQAIKAREKQIEHIEEDIKTSNDDIHQYEKEISELKKNRVEQEKIVSGSTIIIDWAGFEKELHNFTSGWASWMTQNGIIKRIIDDIWVALETFVEAHKQTLK